jgi:hypothetical protein
MVRIFSSNQAFKDVTTHSPKYVLLGNLTRSGLKKQNGKSIPTKPLLLGCMFGVIHFSFGCHLTLNTSNLLPLTRYLMQSIGVS